MVQNKWALFNYAAANSACKQAVATSKNQAENRLFPPCSFRWNRALCLIRSIKTKHVHEENMIFHTPWQAWLNKSIRQTHSGERGGLVTALAHRLLTHFWFMASCGNFTVQMTSIRTDAAKILDQKPEFHTLRCLFFSFKWKIFQTNNQTKPRFFLLFPPYHQDNKMTSIVVEQNQCKLILSPFLWQLFRLLLGSGS